MVAHAAGSLPAKRISQTSGVTRTCTFRKGLTFSWACFKISVVVSATGGVPPRLVVKLLQILNVIPVILMVVERHFTRHLKRFGLTSYRSSEPLKGIDERAEESVHILQQWEARKLLLRR